MAKRKRGTELATENGDGRKPLRKTDSDESERKVEAHVTIQIVAGSYDGILHGVTATIEPQSGKDATAAHFADTFLFNAHESSMRCLALSPPAEQQPQNQKVLLATGSSDERINVYSLAARAPSAAARRRQAAALARAGVPRPILESGHNREVGTLLHHTGTVTRLAFPTRGKLLSAAEDSTIAVARARDWSVLSTIKCPVPRLPGEAAGAAAAYAAAAAPSGVNDFAVHPSLRLMISVSRRERCMRLWNLVTGKKAGVLNFARDLLLELGEGKHGSGEGRRVVWGSSADGGDEFAVAFERNVVVFGMDSKPKCKLVRDARRKLHDLCYVAVDGGAEDMLLAVSTEDGSVLFFSTKHADFESDQDDANGTKKQALPVAKLVAQVGQRDQQTPAGGFGRIKAFKLLPVKGEDGKLKIWHLITGSSDGKMWVWEVQAEELLAKHRTDKSGDKRIGRLLGTYETHNRITCLEAFVMIPRPAVPGDESEGEELWDEVDEGDSAGESEDGDQ